MANYTALTEMDAEDRTRYLETNIALARGAHVINDPSLRPIKDPSVINCEADTIVPPERDDIDHIWTSKQARIILAENRIEFPGLFSFYGDKGDEPEGIGGPEGLMYDPPSADAGKNQDSVTVHLSYRLMKLSWGLQDWAQQEVSDRSAPSTGFQEAWFPAHVNDKGYIVYSPWHIPIVKCSKRGTLHGDRIISSHYRPEERYSCSVLVSYGIEAISHGWSA